MANEKLKKARIDLKKIKDFCKSRPMKSARELSEFLNAEGLNELHYIATLELDLESSKSYYLYTKKINRARV